MSDRGRSGPVKPLPGGWGDYRGVGEGSALSYRTVNAEVVRDAVRAVTDTGDALMFGLTSDGGAFVVSTYHAGQRQTRYFTDVATLQEGLAYLSRVS